MPNYSGVWTLQQQLQARGGNLWPAVPGAPTIGTATSPSSTTASVAFTAPANLGVPAATSYTATSSPGGITGTGAFSPITVSGLATGTTYTFTVTATNTTGTSPASAASNSVTPFPTVIGQAVGGGFYAGQIGVSGVATHYLVIGPLSTAQSASSLQWKTTNTATAGTSSDINGPANSAAMNNASHPAALFCEGLTIGGFSDWYMPAKNELEICYYNLKPTTASNSTLFGANPNAVPARASNYTAGTPAQTSAAAFQSGGSEPFSGSYWSSTEASSTSAWFIIFSNGYQAISGKNGTSGVRAVRRFPV